jgi:pyruvate,orthophosphate dikinase
MYEERKLVPANPFVTIDQPGVGRLMRIAVEEGRAANAEPALRDLRRARRRPGIGRVLPRARARLRELLAVRVETARLAAGQAAVGSAESAST